MGKSNAIFICIGTAALVVLGLVMLASTSVWVSDGGEYEYLKKQFSFAILGVVSASCLAYIDYRILKKYSKWILFGSVVLLICCYIPGIKHTVHGETRWIKFPVIGQFQPSEMAKIGTIVALSSWLAHFQSETRSFKRGFLIPSIILATPVLLIFFETDMGTAAGLGAAGLCVLYVAGTKLRYLAPSVLASLGAFVYLVVSNENRYNRIMAFMDLEEHKLGFGLQQFRGLLAFMHGGVDGLGLGNSAEKHGYLPFAHTDFIFPIVGEELGLWYTLGTVFCFVLIAVYGIGVAINAKDMFGRLLAIGVTSSIVIPAMMNIGVVTALLPNTGLPLPFVSYGGTSLVFTLAGIGVLVSIHRKATFNDEQAVNFTDKERTIRI